MVVLLFLNNVAFLYLLQQLLKLSLFLWILKVVLDINKSSVASVFVYFWLFCYKINGSKWHRSKHALKVLHHNGYKEPF